MRSAKHKGLRTKAGRVSASASSSAIRNPHFRHGLTLLEVLIAIFVMAVGLMGLAALIPVGRHDVLEGSKADRANACGRAAFRDVKVRKMLTPGMWMNGDATDDTPSGTPPMNPQTWYDLSIKTNSPSIVTGPLENAAAPFSTSFASFNSICIDPLFVASAMNSGAGSLSYWRSFPYALDNDPTTPQAVGGNTLNPPRMARATLRSWPATNTYPLGYAAAERIFRCEDDVQFALNTDETKRPNPVWSDNRLQPKGDYSWLITATPVSVSANGVPAYSVSTVVFYKRSLVLPDFTNAAQRSDGPPGERLVYADFLSGGIGVGGGDVRLRLPTSSSDDDPDTSDFPRLRPSSWIMLCAWTNDASPRQVYQWYRITSVGQRADGQNGPEYVNSGTPSGNPEWQQDVTLDGPDWDGSLTQITFYDADNVNAYTTVFAALFENVVGVYTKTIEADTWAGWE